MVPPPDAGTLVPAASAHNSPADIKAARERAKQRTAGLRVALPELEKFARSQHPMAAAVLQLLESYNVATAEASVYREMFAALAYPRAQAV